MIPSALEYTVFCLCQCHAICHLAFIPSLLPGGVCVRQSLQFDSGYCFLVGSSLNSTCSAAVGWVLQEGSGISQGRSSGNVIACGTLPAFKLDAWHNISLAASSDGRALTIIASIDGAVAVHQSETEPVKWQKGMVSLRSGYHYALFDDLAIV